MAKMTYKGSVDGSHQKIERWAVNASQTIIDGQFVIYSSGKVTTAAATVAANSILGVSMEAITTTSSVDADDAILVDTNPNSIYEMDYTATTVAVGTAYDLSNAYTLNQGDTSPGAIRVLEVDTTNVRCDVIVEDGYHFYG